MKKTAVENAIMNSAEHCGVSPKVDSQDFIFQFLINNPSFKSPEAAVDYYFQDGGRSCAKLVSIVDDIFHGSETKISLLEFASGYGCVTRHLAKHDHIFDITACDIHERAVNFTQDALKVRAVQSTHVPDDLNLRERFDVVFALSFFSHMPHHTWLRWLKKLYDLTATGGCVIFTTHGLASRPFLGDPAIPDEGFWFSPQSEQGDLDTSDYGLTIVTLDFVANAVRQNFADPLWLYRYAYWWEHQDLYVIRKFQ